MASPGASQAAGLMAHAPKPSDVLEAAAKLIEPEGAWIQGELAQDEDGDSAGDGDWSGAVCFCASGAIGFVATSENLWDRAVGYLSVAIGHFPFPAWNDAPERTQAEVVTALRKAAEIARAQGQ